MNRIAGLCVLAATMQGIGSSPAHAQQAAPGEQAASFGAQFGPVDPRVEMRTYVFADTGERIPYGVFVSSSVTMERKAPLVVALHGLGASQESMVRTSFRAVELAEKGGYILVVPLGYNSSGWYGVQAGGSVQQQREYSEKDVMNVLAMVRDEFNIDDDRIFLMGHSMGGAGTLHLGMKYPSIWAALAPIAPATAALDPDSLASIRHMPVIIVQGDADTAVPVAVTRRWASKLRELQMTFRYIEIPGGDHMGVIGTGMPDIFAFFEAHPKNHH